MAIAVGASTPGSKASVDSSDLSFSHTGNGEYLRVKVAALTSGGTGEVVSGVTFGGEPMVRVGVSADFMAQVWELANPSASTASVVVTPARDCALIAAATNYTGVDLSDPSGGAVLALDQGASAALNAQANVPTDPGDLVTDAAFLVSSGVETLTPGVAQAERANHGFDVLGVIFGQLATSDATGGSSTQMQWSGTGNALYIVAVPLHAAPDTPGAFADAEDQAPAQVDTGAASYAEPLPPVAAVLWSIEGEAEEIVRFGADAAGRTPRQADSSTAGHEAPTFAVETSDASAPQVDTSAASLATVQHTGTGSEAAPAQADASTAAHSSPASSAHASDASPAQVDLADTSFATVGHNADGSDTTHAQTDSATGTYSEHLPSIEAVLWSLDAETEDVQRASADGNDASPAQFDSASASLDTAPHAGSGADRTPAQADASAAAHEAPESSASASDASPSQADSSGVAHAAPSFIAEGSDSGAAQADSVAASLSTAAHTASASDTAPAQRDSGTGSHTETVDTSVAAVLWEIWGEVTEVGASHTASSSDAGPAQVDQASASHTAPAFAASASDESPAQRDQADGLHEASSFTGQASDEAPAQTDNAAARHALVSHAATGTDHAPAQADTSQAGHAAPQAANAEASDHTPAQNDSATGQYATTAHPATATDEAPSQVDSAAAEHEAPSWLADIHDATPSQRDSADADFASVTHTGAGWDSAAAQADSATATLIRPAYATGSDISPTQLDEATALFNPHVHKPPYRAILTVSSARHAITVEDA